MRHPQFGRRFTSCYAERLERRRLLNASGYTTAVVVDIGLAIPDQHLVGGLTADARGDLFAVTQGDDKYAAAGTVFELPAGTDSVTVLCTFPAGAGTPQMAPVVDAAGDLFGTTYGDAANFGTVYEIPAGTTSAVTLATFDASTGAAPSNLVLDATGDVYGTTYQTTLTGGPAPDEGTVFEVPAGGGSIRTVAGDSAVCNPAGLAFDAAGNLYGVGAATPEGGGSVVFRIDAGTTGYAAVVPVSDGTPSDEPYAMGRVVFDAAGDLFGVDDIGSLNAYGAVVNSDTGFDYELPSAATATGASAVSILHMFASADGQEPSGPLSIDAAGDLFGVTSQPSSYFVPIGTGGGSVYELTAGAGDPRPFVTVPAFTASGPVIRAANGVFFGTGTANVQLNNGGSVFALYPPGVGIPTAVGLISSATAGTAIGGRPVTFEAGVIGDAAVLSTNLTGTVTFTDAAGDVLGTAAVEGTSGVQVSISTTELAVGVDMVTATYSGDDTFASATSVPLSITVAPPPPAATITLTVTPVTPAPGDVPGLPSVLVAVRVDPSVAGGPVPTGTVTVTGAYGPLTLVNGAASSTATAVTAGIYRYTASYSGDDFNGPTESAPQLVTVTAQGPVPTIVSDPFPVSLAAGADVKKPVRMRLALPRLSGRSVAEAVEAFAFLTTNPTYSPGAPGDSGRTAPAGVEADSLGGVRVHVRTGGSTVASIAVPSLPPTVVPGTYYLVVGESDGSGEENLLAAPTTVTVTAVQVSLVSSLAIAGPSALPDTRAPMVRLTISNAGPADVTGRAIVEVGLTADAAAAPSAVSYLAPSVRTLHIPAGGSVTLLLRIRLYRFTGDLVEYPAAQVTADGVTAGTIGTGPFKLVGTG